jgi:sporulation protein YlmC with PRC-barrel domain
MAQMQNTSYDGWIGRNAYDSTGEKIGEIKDVFYDDRTGRPEWITVKTGMFKGSTFVPIHGSSVYRQGDGDEDDLQLSFDKEMIKDAPRIDDEGDLTPAQEQELWAYYGYDYEADPKLKTHGYGTNYTRNRADKDYVPDRYDRSRNEWVKGDLVGEQGGEVVSEATAVSESVEKTQTPETVRLRKYRRTEMVPVTKEEIRVENVAESDTTTTGKVRSNDPRTGSQR